MADTTTSTVQHKLRPPRGLTGSIILIGIGAALLLSNLGMVSIDWLSLLRYWPVILVLLGLDLVLGRSIVGSIIGAIIGLAIVGGIIFGVGLRDDVDASAGRSITREIRAIETGDIETLRAEVTIGAARARVAALETGENVVEGSYTLDERTDLVVDYDMRNGEGRLSIAQDENSIYRILPSGGFINEMDLYLTNAVPVDLTIRTGASSVELDLTGMNLSKLTIEGGAGSIVIILPESGAYDVAIHAGVGSLNITVPETMEGLIVFNGALTTLDVADQFENVNGEWLTEDYSEDAENRVKLTIDAAIGSITIR